MLFRSSKFGSDLDPATVAILEKGKRLVEVLKQPQYSPAPVEKQVAIIYLGTKGLLRSVPVEKIKEFEHVFLTEMERRHATILDNFRKGKFDDADLKQVEALANELTMQYKK